MFSPLNDPNLIDWFRRLDAAWKRMPADEQTRQREEVQQHLEALAAANEELGSSPSEALELALMQFGDPTKFGHRMAHEWQRRQGWISEEGAFVLYIVGMYAVSAIGTQAVRWLIPTLYHSLTGVDISVSISTLACELVGVPIATGLAIGRRYPDHALAGTLYAVSFTSTLPFFTALFALPVESPAGAWTGWETIAGYAVGLLAGSFLLTGFAAYLASVTKRGWYRPTLADFKLTLPKRRQIVR